MIKQKEIPVVRTFERNKVETLLKFKQSFRITILIKIFFFFTLMESFNVNCQVLDIRKHKTSFLLNNVLYTDRSKSKSN